MKMGGTDLRGATIWMTLPPEWDSSGLTDLTEFAIRPLDEGEQTAVKEAAKQARRRGRAGARQGEDRAAGRQDRQVDRQRRSAALAELARGLSAAAGRHLQVWAHELPDEAHVLCALEQRLDCDGHRAPRHHAGVPRRRGRRLRRPAHRVLPGLEDDPAQGDARPLLHGGVGAQSVRHGALAPRHDALAGPAHVALRASAWRLCAPCQSLRPALIIEHKWNISARLKGVDNPRPTRGGGALSRLGWALRLGAEACDAGTARPLEFRKCAAGWKRAAPTELRSATWLVPSTR